MAAGLTILITGASRGTYKPPKTIPIRKQSLITPPGIGKALVTAYLSQPNNTVIAAVRNPADPGPQSLPSLPTGPNTTLIVVPLEATSPPSIAAALRTLDHDHGVRHLDVVVANAGAAFGLGGKLAVLDPATAIQQNIDVNAYGPLWLFQHSLPLLRGAKEPVFVAVSSAAASRALLQFTGGIPMGGYAVAKALLNTIVARLAVEEEDVVTLALDPG